jgi:hypothetical protein
MCSLLVFFFTSSPEFYSIVLHFHDTFKTGCNSIISNATTYHSAEFASITELFWEKTGSLILDKKTK